MNREAQSVVVLLFGGVLIGVTVSGKYTAYVKPGFGPLLVGAGIVLMLVGLASLAQSALRLFRHARESADTASEAASESEAVSVAASSDHGHDHDRSRAPWLLLAPVLMLVAVAPTALGADAVGRNAGSQEALGLEAGVSPASAPEAAPTSNEGYARNDGSGTARDADGRKTMPFPDLPPGENPTLTFKNFVLRALYDGQQSVTENPVTLVGFIAPAGEGYTDGYTIARLSISCCAADANPIRIHVDGDPPFPSDTWVAAVVTAVPDSGNQGNSYVPTATVNAIEQVSPPSDPYEL